MNEIIQGNYQLEEARTLDVIASEIKIIEKQTTQAVLTGAIEIGKRLSEAKEQIEHGGWETWCTEHLNYTREWASKLIRISEEYGDADSPYAKAISNVNTSSHLSISNALRLLQVPENEVENFVEEHPDVSDLKVKELEDEIKKLKEDMKAQELEKEDLENDIAVSDDEIKRLKVELAETRTELSEAKETVKESDGPSEEDLKKLEDIKAKLEKKIAKLEENTEKLKAEHAKEIETKLSEAKTEALDNAKKEVAQQIAETEAALKKAKEEADAAKAEVEKMQKQLAQSNNEQIATHKVKLQMLKKTFDDIIKNIDTMPDEDRERIREGFKRFLTTLAENV